MQQAQGRHIAEEGRDYYEIVVKQEPNAYLSSWLGAHNTEQPLIRVSQPEGNFVLDNSTDRPVVYFAGGIGVTPAIAFARSLAAKKYLGRLHVDYSAYTEKDFIFVDELLAIAKNLDLM